MINASVFFFAEFDQNGNDSNFFQSMRSEIVRVSKKWKEIAPDY